MFACMYVGMCVCKYVGKWVCRYVCRDVCVCMYVHAQMLDASLQYLPRTCADPCCYVIGSFLVHAQTVDVTLHDLLLYTRRQLMQRYKELQDLLSYFRRRLMSRYKIFSCTCTDTWCYIHRPSLVLVQTEVIRSSLVLAHLHRHLGLVLP